MLKNMDHDYRAIPGFAAGDRIEFLFQNFVVRLADP